MPQLVRRNREPQRSQRREVQQEIQRRKPQRRAGAYADKTNEPAIKRMIPYK